MKKVNSGSQCPCGSDKLYEECCWEKEFEWHQDSEGKYFRSIPIKKEFQKFLDKQGMTLEECFEKYHETDPEATLNVLMEAGVPEEFIYAHLKTGLFVTEMNKDLLPDCELEEWQSAIDEYWEKGNEFLKESLDKNMKDSMVTDFDKLSILGGGSFILGVPENSDEEFRKMVFAAAKAYFTNESIDQIFDKFSETWDLKDSPSYSLGLLRRVCDTIRKEVDLLIDSLPKPSDLNPQITGLFAGIGAIKRLVVTYKMSFQCLKQGFWLEASTLVKQIMEQISWVYKIRSLDYESLQKVLPSKCISDCKEIFPGIGKMYGVLNHEAHINPKNTHSYLKADESASWVIMSWSNH
jgi:hypothetical protein